MSQLLTYALLREESELFAGSGGVSEGNRRGEFIPAFYDTHSCQTVVSRFTNGTPAPIHVLEGLPNEWIVARDTSGKVAAVKASVISGFIRLGKFYTREQAAQYTASCPSSLVTLEERPGVDFGALLFGYLNLQRCL